MTKVAAGWFNVWHVVQPLMWVWIFSSPFPRGAHGGRECGWDTFGSCCGGRGMRQRSFSRYDVRVVLESWGEREKGVYDRVGLVFLLDLLVESHAQKTLLAGFNSSIKPGIRRHRPLSAGPRAPYQPRVVLEAIDLHPTDATGIVDGDRKKQQPRRGFARKGNR